jgi:hypothetical protein
VYSVLEDNLKRTSGSLKAEGLGDAISKPVSIMTSMRVGVIGPWPNRKQFKVSDKKLLMVFMRFSFFSRGDNDRDRASAIPIVSHVDW